MTELQMVSTIQQWVMSSPLLVALAVYCARWLILVFGVFFLFLLVGKRNASRHAVREAVWSALLALFFTAVIQYFVQRPRPFLALPDPGFPITALIPEPFNTSFPSGHTATSFAMASAIAFFDRRWGIAALGAASIVALARIATGVHYPSDVLGGIVVGIGAFAIVRFLHAQIRTPDIERSAKTHHHE